MRKYNIKMNNSDNRQYKSKKEFTCIDCGTTFRAPWSKLKRCPDCRKAYWRKKEAIMKTGSIHRYSKPTGQKIHCHKCGKLFELKEWQWEGMAWCGICRHSPDYLYYHYHDTFEMQNVGRTQNQIVREYYQTQRQLSNYYGIPLIT